MIKLTKPISRIVQTKNGPLVITLDERTVRMRERRCAERYPPVSYDAIYDLMARLAALDAPAKRKRSVLKGGRK